MSERDGGAQASDYYYRRAEAELKMAQAATDANAVRAHYELANLYLERVPSRLAGDRATAD